MLTVDDLIRELNAARNALPLGGNTVVVISLTGSELEPGYIHEVLTEGSAEDGTSLVTLCVDLRV